MSKKKVYVLYSIAGEISPKLYKTKATVQKYLSKNKNLSFYEFPNETSAQQYIRKLQTKAHTHHEAIKVPNLKQKKTQQKIKVQEQVKTFDNERQVVDQLQKVERRTEVEQQKFQLQEEVQVIGKREKDNRVEKEEVRQRYPQFVQLKLKSLGESDKDKLFKAYKRLNHFYKPTLLSLSQPLLNLTVSQKRRQNPGFTTASYKFYQGQSVLCENNVKLGVTRNSQGIIQAIGSALMDVIHSNYLSGTIRLCLSEQNLVKGQKSLDVKIREITQFVQKVRSIGFQIL